MVEPPILDFGSLRHGDHICLPYDDGKERDEVVVPFIAEGLARGERCLYVVDEASREGLLGWLSTAGVNASRALERGALWLRTPAQVYLGNDRFDPGETLNVVEELMAGALADGFTGLRGSGEIMPCERTGIPWETVLEYEVRFNERFAKRPFVALCRYHRHHWPAAIIADALRTHPTAIVGGRVCRNPYYEKPDVALATDRDAARVEWMLYQLRRSAACEQRAQQVTSSLAGETARLSAENQSRARAEEELALAVRLRDRFLDDLGKELAGPVGGLAVEFQALARASAADDRLGRDDHRTRATGIAALGNHLKRLGAVLEELKEVSRITNRRAVHAIEDVDLVDVARQVALRSREKLAALGSTISFHGEARIQGRWDRRRLEQLIANLLSNAAKRGAGRPIDLGLASDGATAIVSVRYSGKALPGDDDDVAFDHGTPAPALAGPSLDGATARSGGAGLWVAREIAGAFGGALHLSMEGPDVERFTVLTVELLRSAPARTTAATKSKRKTSRNPATS